MAAVLLLCFLYLLLSLTAFYFVGSIILKVFRYKADGFYADLFDNALVGLTTSVFLFSVFTSHFKTVQWGILIVALFAWYEIKVTGSKRSLSCNSNQHNIGWSSKTILPLFGLVVLVFAWFAYPTLNWSGDFIYAIPHKDKVYYSNIATSLAEYGNENREGAYVPGVTSSVTEPYHYFDLWLAAMLSVVTLKPTVLVISLLCLPLCSLISIFGVLAVFERSVALKFWHYLLAFLLLFIRGIYLETNDPQIAWGENFSESILEFKSEKLGVLYIFAILAFRILLSGNIVAALATLLFLPIISIGNFPGVMGGVLLFALISVLLKWLRHRKHYVFWFIV